MKIQIHKITVTADFTNIEELRKVLEEVVSNYEAGFREYKKPFVNWIAHPKAEVSMDIKPIVGDLIDEGYKYKDIDGVRYMVLQSKMNK